ncbi:ABC transporter permease [Actinomadura vinacea]|uniref:ABC transporter permease n=1 Tax=Actinomadura vinacea TaxID=115336 RepID=A0ABN3JXY8_9ACTN
MLRTIGGTALGDFRDRVRRPAYAITLLAAIGLGYLAMPDTGSRLVIMYIGEHRGVYNSAYAGTVTALASALWLTLGGFYVVRNAVDRDDRTGVGRLLAATPLRTSAYLAAKLLSNTMVLGSMVAVLAGTAVVMQLARGEDRGIDPIALLTPFAVIALPLVAPTAAAALLSETVPVLRSGVGGIAWFFVWMAGTIGSLSARAPFDLLGARHISRSLRDAKAGHGIGSPGDSFSLGLTEVPEPLKTFAWEGFPLSPAFIVGRAVLVLAAVAVALLPVAWFGRFDPARGRLRKAPEQAPQTEHVPASASGFRGLPSTAPTRGGTFGRLLVGELSLILRDAPIWWWLVAAGLAVAGLAGPLDAVSSVLLPLAWVWPVLLWSRLGTRHHRDGVDGLIAAYPATYRRVLAEWTAGFAVTALLGLTPLARMAATADWAGTGAWLGGALLIPSLSLAAGTLSRTPKLFQAVYPPLWYGVFNGLAALDFMGAVRTDGQLAGPSPLAIGVLAALLLTLALLTGPAHRHAGNLRRTRLRPRPN